MPCGKTHSAKSRRIGHKSWRIPDVWTVNLSLKDACTAAEHQAQWNQDGLFQDQDQGSLQHPSCV